MPNGGVAIAGSVRIQMHRSVGCVQPAVDQLHTYYVLAGGTPVLVHNSQCTVLPSKSTDEYAVIGRKGKNAEEGDVDVAVDWEDHEVLRLSKLTIEQNDQWIQGAIDSRQKVYIASSEWGNLKSPSGRETIFSRELGQLRNAGYTRDGDYLLRPQQGCKFSSHNFLIMMESYACYSAARMED